MSASLSIPHPLGVQLWWVGNGVTETWITCEECAGKKVHTLTLGNGETYTVGCECCGDQYYTPPRGMVRVYVNAHEPVPFTALRVRMDGSEFSYSKSPPESGCYSSVNAKNLFATREECEAECARRNAETSERNAQQDWKRLDHKKKYAWSVHYWRSEVKRHERDAESARARLQVVIAKKGEPESEVQP